MSEFEKSRVGEIEGNAVVQRAVWNIKSVTRTHVHTAQDFHDVKLELAHLVRIFAVEDSAQPVNRAQQAVKDCRKAYGLRKGRPHMRKPQPFVEAVMYLRVVRDEGETEVRGQVEHRHLLGSHR